MEELKNLYAVLGELNFNAEILNNQIIETKKKIVSIINIKSKEVKDDAK